MPASLRGVTDLIERARAWAAEDPEPDTRAELERAIEKGDTDELADRFDGTLEFGTAGLRGALGAGSNRMNRVVVTRAAAGLAAYLRDQGVGRDAAVVIGYDARHNSDVFARDTAEVMTGAGIKALLLPRPLPTPVLAFAIRELGCVAGVMVTASHNPPRDNGYKVYLGDGSQIVPPADAEIAARIAAVGPLAEVPRTGGWRTLGEDIVDSYLDTVAGLAGDGPRDLRLVYTPLHGVGGTSVVQVLETAGFDAPYVVEQQEQPDPDFPTVAFPNPEEPGAMDLATALAARRGVDLVVANDPDADRCAAAVPDAHGWRILRGRPAVHGDADRLQVDQQGRRSRVRLRGGAGLLRRPRAREGQGRGLGPAPALRARRRGEGPGAGTGRRARRPRARPRSACHRPALGPRHRPRADRRGHGPTAHLPSHEPGRAAGGVRRRPGPGLGRSATDGRAALPLGQRCPRGRPAERDGAEAQVLSRGRRTGGSGGGCRRGPHLGRRAARRAARRHQGRRRHLSQTTSRATTNATPRTTRAPISSLARRRTTWEP